jgi:hypothetical protein
MLSSLSRFDLATNSDKLSVSQYAGKDGHAYPSQRALAAELGVSPRQVRKYVTELLQFKLVATRQYGLAQTNAYLFLWHEWAEEGIRQGVELEFRSGRNYRSRGEELSFHSERNHSSDKENQEELQEENQEEQPRRDRDDAEEAQTCTQGEGCGIRHQPGLCGINPWDLVTS